MISDIHGNLPALEAVLERVEDCDEIWCLGDMVGYGPWPNDCAGLVEARCSVVLAGNHDLAAVGRVPVEAFSSDAGRAIAWTREALTDPTEAYLSDLEPSLVGPFIALFHASPIDPVWQYVLDPGIAKAALDACDRELILVGHTHSALAARLADGVLTGGPARGGLEISLRQGVRALLNPGSVGQPRDGDARAAWLELEIDDAGRAVAASFHRVAYDIERAQQRVYESGLPERLAFRLAFGM